MSTPEAVIAFHVGDAAVRVRGVQIGEGVLDPILRRHAYPPAVARLLGEALLLASLLGHALKFDGKLVLQVQGDGPVPLLVAEYVSGGALRGYARLDPERVDQITGSGPAALCGQGVLALTVDQGAGTLPYQGMVALGGDRLGAMAEAFFSQSEQVPTAVRLAVSEVVVPGAAPYWFGGGMLIQRVAADAARSDTAEAWETVTALFGTLTDGELADPGLQIDRVAVRLFHELGVARSEAQPLSDQCSCSRERFVGVVAQLEPDVRAGLADPDGWLRAKCQFCAREHAISPEEAAGFG
jgi:molecular chaperone Hsp33